MASCIWHPETTFNFPNSRPQLSESCVLRDEQGYRGLRHRMASHHLFQRSWSEVPLDL